MDNKEIVLNIMRNSSKNAYLLTSVDNQPRGRIVSPVVDDDLSIWIVTIQSSRKIKDIRQNPKIAITFNEYPNNGFREVQVFGKAELHTGKAEKLRVWNLKKDSIGSFFQGGVEDEAYALLKVKIDYIEWSDHMQGCKNIINFPI